ncbi:hypothetical protein LXA43DRAFT_646381 [Ganoderma leucocontextum]|nr:hypothetical protein LXA43DRAFT_646381 [Ganoderma leucocontextum]
MSTWKVMPCATSALAACHDILAMIFDHLAPGRIDLHDPDRDMELLRQRCRNTLAASALAGSIISHHALNVLWRELDNVHPLLKVLPNYKRVDSRFALCGAILPEHWTRFQLYADRVRVILGGPRQLEDAIEPSVWLFLAARCKGSPLMPRLRELFAYNIPIPEISTLVLLISPTLRVVDLSLELEDEDDSEIAPHVVASLLHTLPLMAPDLEDLTYYVDFGIGRGSVNLDHGYLESFGLHFARLKTLSIRCAVRLDKQVLQLLSSIPTLQDLSCTIDIRSNSTLTLPRCTFQQLTDLHIEGHLDHLVTFFHVCQFPTLACITLRIRVLGPPNAQGPKDSFAAICQCCNPTLLTSFSVDIMDVFISNSSRPRSLVQYLEPLLAFPNITSFHFLCFYIVPPVHDDDIARFGAAWLRLESFHVSHIVGQYSLPDVARPTLSGLIELAQRCPRLDMFHIPELDITVVPERNAVPLLAHGLRYFTMRNAMPSSPSKVYMEVATLIDCVFPAVDLEYSWSVSKFNGEEWKDILQFLEAMRLGRENAALRADIRQG